MTAIEYVALNKISGSIVFTITLSVCESDLSFVYPNNLFFARVLFCRVSMYELDLTLVSSIFVYRVIYTPAPFDKL